MPEIRIANKTLSPPASWNELSIGQISVFVNYIYRQRKKIFGWENSTQGPELAVLDPAYLTLAKIALLRSILDIQDKLFRQISDEDIHALIFEHGLVDFFFEPSTFTRQPLPEVSFKASGKKIKYYGPSDSFDNLRMGEFVFAEQLCADIQHEFDEEKLNELIAVLFRPGRPGYDPEGPDAGDRRIRFTPFSVDARKEIVKQLPLEHRIAVYLWYDGCRSQLMHLYPEPFEPGDEGSGEPPRLIDILISAAGNDMLRVHDAEQTLVQIAFATISKQIREVKALKERMKKENP